MSKDMNRRSVLAAGAGTVSTLLLAGCTSDDETGREDGNANGGDGSGDGSGSGGGNDGGSSVEILDHEWYEEQYSSGVKGTVENVSDEELSYVEVSAYFLDSEGTQIGDGLDNFTDLAPGRKAEFDCVFLGDDPSRVEEYEVEASVTNF